MDIRLKPKYKKIFIYVKMDVHAGKILKFTFLIILSIL